MSRKICFDTVAEEIATELYMALLFDLPKNYIIINEDINDLESDLAQRKMAAVLIRHGAFADDPKKPEINHQVKQASHAIHSGALALKIKKSRIRQESEFYDHDLFDDYLCAVQ